MYYFLYVFHLYSIIRNVELLDKKTLEVTFPQYDIVQYKTSVNPIDSKTGKSIRTYEKHHGIMNVWAEANIKNYKGKQAPAIVLTISNHRKTTDYFSNWRKRETGSITGYINWKKMSFSEIYSLSEKMFNAAKTPKKHRDAYYQAFAIYIYHTDRKFFNKNF